MTDRAKDRLEEMARHIQSREHIPHFLIYPALERAYELGRADENESCAKELEENPEGELKCYGCDCHGESPNEWFPSRIRSRLSGTGEVKDRE